MTLMYCHCGSSTEPVTLNSRSSFVNGKVTGLTSFARKESFLRSWKRTVKSSSSFTMSYFPHALMVKTSPSM